MSPQAMLDPKVDEAKNLATAQAYADVWRANARVNRVRIHHTIDELWEDSNPRKGVLIAAGPSLDKSMDELKALDRHTHEIVAVDMALKPLLAAGVVPDFVIAGDHKPEIARLLVADAPADVALLLPVVADKATGVDWIGPIFWFNLASNVFDHKSKSFLQRDQELQSGVHAALFPGGNVSSMGLAFLQSVRACAKIMLFGHDFCWTDDEHFYSGGVESLMSKDRINSDKVLNMNDQYGNPVKTNSSMLMFAEWYEQVAAKMPGLLENRTPTTILKLQGEKTT